MVERKSSKLSIDSSARASCKVEHNRRTRASSPSTCNNALTNQPTHLLSQKVLSAATTEAGIQKIV